MGRHGTTLKHWKRKLIYKNALLLKSKLEAAGAQVMLTRSTDQYISLEERVQLSISEQASASSAFITIQRQISRLMGRFRFIILRRIKS